MKKFVFALIAFSSLMVLSCRQQEEMMDSEDLKSLSVLNEATRKSSNAIQPVSDTIVTVKTAETSNLSIMEVDMDKIQPPR